VALGVEDVHLVAAADGDAELGRARVEIDGVLLGGVDAPEIDGEMAVDEQEQVVVAAERERLAAAMSYT
jgi:hypothetical protein